MGELNERMLFLFGLLSPGADPKARIQVQVLYLGNDRRKRSVGVEKGGREGRKSAWQLMGVQPSWGLLEAMQAEQTSELPQLSHYDPFFLICRWSRAAPRGTNLWLFELFSDLQGPWMEGG